MPAANQEQTTELLKRTTSFMADRLETAHPDASPTMRLRMSYDAAVTLVLNARWSGKLDFLTASLDRLMSESYEI